MSSGVTFHRQTKESDITVALDFSERSEPDANTGLPFLDHMLSAMAFHGGFSLAVDARGDLEVDPHHLVEDTGMVIGTCLSQLLEKGTVARFGHAVIPMDEALSEVTVDVCGRATLVYAPNYPQEHSGEFPMWLFREFFCGLVSTSRIALHLNCRSGENAHHMIESLFKALGKALAAAYAPVASSSAGTAAMSTKGKI